MTETPDLHESSNDQISTDPRHSTDPQHTGVSRHRSKKMQQGHDRERSEFGFFAPIFAAFEESWAEVQVNKVRILFSLLGVFIAVTALATVVGFGAILSQVTTEQNERWAGRPATITMNGYSDKISKAEYVAKVDELIERYSLTATTRLGYGNLRVQFVDGVTDVTAQLFDREYGETRRVLLKEGHWFTEQDTKRFAPAMVVNEAFWNRLGSPNLANNPTVELLGENAGTAVIVGVTPSYGDWDTYPEAMMLYDSYRFTVWEEGNFPDYQFWVKPEISEELRLLIEQEMQAFVGFDPSNWMNNSHVSVYRSDMQGDMGGFDGGALISWVFGGVSLVILIIGGLGVLNIAMVTIKQRVREIGIRRSFGATSGRIFFSVMMESVVATVFAGVLGIIVSVILLRNEFLFRLILQNVPLQEMPPYPLQAAIIALIATVAVGALAGLIPALYAVNAKVIDAIRY